MNDKMLGHCPDCNIVVWSSDDYYYDVGIDKYWHECCLTEDENIGYE